MNQLKTHVFFPAFFIMLGSIFSAKAQSFIWNPVNCYCNGVSITAQPQSPLPNCPAGGASAITVGVSGTGPFTYRWQENLSDVADGGPYSGATTATLTITNPPIGLNGKTYRCIVSNCTGKKIAITNNAAILTVTTIPADINLDGLTNVSDFAQFIQSFNTACLGCREDINQDALVNVDDFLQLVSNFNKDCK